MTPAPFGAPITTDARGLRLLYGIAFALAVAAGGALVWQYFEPGHVFRLKTGLVIVAALVVMGLATLDSGRTPSPGR